MRKLYTIIFIALSFCGHGQNYLIVTDTTKAPEINLGEIVVEASRDNSRIKDIPASIAIINAKQIENNNIQSLEDVTARIPNFIMMSYGTKIMSPVYIRGIGSKKNSPSVGLYVDGIPYYENSALNFDFYDLAGVEVLRGPQGTLYGRNTIGGLININTISPLKYQGTNIRLSGGTYSHYNANVGHYDKIGDKFAYSLSGNYRNQGGFFENQYNGDMADKLESLAFRNRLAYQINNKWLIENIASLENSIQDGYPYGTYNDSLDAIESVNYNQASGYKRFMFNNGFKVNFNNDNIVANATIGYQLIDDEQKIDQDFKPDSIYYVVQDQQQNMLSFEGVVRSKGERKYNWLFGAFGFNQQLNKHVNVDIYSANMVSMKEYNLKVLSGGLFHQSTFKPTEKLSIIAGIRYNYESSELDYAYNLEMSGKLIPRLDSVFPKLEEHIPLPKIAAIYSFDPINLYASYSTGYKPGGFNSTFEENWQLMFENEMSHNYEIGLKGSFLNGFLYSDLTYFLSNIKGQQFNRSLETQTGTYIDNTGESRNQGIEFTIALNSIKGFEANLNYGYTQARIQKYELNDSVNYNGNTTPFVPEHTFNLMLAKNFYINNVNAIDKIRLQADLQQIGKSYWNIDSENNQRSNTSYTLLNVRASFDLSKLSIAFWARNLLNSDYNTYMFSVSNNWFGQKGQPRQFGTTLSIKLNSN